LTVHTSPTLPAPVLGYFDFSNKGDLNGLVGCFADDALVNDQHREIRGKASIRHWADREIIGSKVKKTIVEAVSHHGDFIVRAKVDGDFDRTGLPDPLILHFYFSVREEGITQLIILLNKA
jgi:ketosteroid isomerase-like protein